MSIPNYYRPGDPLDKIIPFLCPTCGGINDARQYTLLRIASGIALCTPCKKCDCTLTPAMKPQESLVICEEIDELTEVCQLFGKSLYVRLDWRDPEMARIDLKQIRASLKDVFARAEGYASWQEKEKEVRRKGDL